MAPESPVEVIVFDHKPTKSVNDSKRYTQFMSSKVNKRKREPKSIPVKQTREKEMNKQDKELGEILQGTKLAEKLNVDSLQGKERHQYIKSKLGIKDPKVSFPIYLGMKKAAEKRTAKKVQELKNLGLHSAINVRHVVEKERTLRGKDKKKAEKKDHGLVGSLGKYRPGVLSVPRPLIHQVQRGKKR